MKCFEIPKKEEKSEVKVELTVNMKCFEIYITHLSLKW